MSTTTVQSNFDSGDRLWFKIGALSFILGIALLIAVLFLHPHQSNPSDNPAIFAEYAADTRWLGTHLMQLFGTMLFMVPSFLAIYCSFAIEGSSTRNLARFGMAVSLLTFAIRAAHGHNETIHIEGAVPEARLVNELMQALN